MKSVRTRVGAVLVVLASVTVGLVVTQGSQAGATPLQYQCVGVTNDVAAKVANGGSYQFVNGQIVWVINYVSYSTAGFLAYVQGLVGGFGGVVTQKPILTADVSNTDANGIYAQGTTVTRHFSASVSLPSDLVSDAATYLGLSSIALRHSTFSIAGAGTTPASITSPIADQTVPLVAGQTITAPVSGPFQLTGPTGFATYTPGQAHVELLVDPVAYPNGTGKHIASIYYNGIYIGTDFYVIGLRFDCNPYQGTPTVGFDQITGGATTTTTQPATTTTTTQPATTTTTQPATTTTTVPDTTTTTQPATTTTTLPGSTTTTTTVPGTHSISVTVGGAGYTNSGPVTSGSFIVTPGTFVGGAGTLAGTHGGSATVSISIQKFLVWGFGTVTVTDPGAGLAPVTGYVLFGAAPSNTTTAYGFSFAGGVFRSYTITVTIN